MKPLRSGIVGVGGYGRLLLNALGDCDRFEVVAIGDQDRELSQHLASLHGAAAYDDYRSLVVQEDIEAVFLALPTFLCGECIRTAAKKSLHVYKEAPLGRTLPEAAEWTAAIEKAQRRFHVGAAHRFAAPYVQARRLLQEQAIGEVYLVRAEAWRPWPTKLDWRGDPQLAGGGALLENGYGLVDMIVSTLGEPEQVYALAGAIAAENNVPPARTEDSAIVALKFADGAVGSVQVGWLNAPPNERLVWQGTAGTICASPTELQQFDAQGQLRRHESYPFDEAALIAEQVRHFGAAIRDDELPSLSPAREHVTNVAVIESAYLSSRTRMPETLTVYGASFPLTKD